MVEETIDRRRRSIIQLVATSLGGLSVRSTAAAGPPTRPAGDQPVTGGPPERAATGFRIDRTGGGTQVFRDGDDDPFFHGTPTAAIQRAVDAGAASDDGTIISLSPGTYEIETSISVASSTWLTGSGSATTMRAAADLDADLLRLPPGTDHVTIARLRLDGNRAENSAGAAVHVSGGAWRPIFEHLIVRDWPDAGIRFSGGPEQAYSYEPVLLDLDVARCGGDGFEFGYTGDLFGANVYAEACERSGFTMADAGGTLIHTHAYDSRGEAGIRILPSAKDLTLVGAHAERNHRHGMIVEGERVSIKNAFIANNSRADPGTDAGIVLDGATDCLVSECSLVNDLERGATQGHGIRETERSGGTRISENLFRHNATAPVDRPVTASDCTYRHNRGYETENGGTRAIRSGDRIQHELARRPTRFRVQSMHPAVRVTVVDVDETALAVELRAVDTGASYEGSIDAAWEAFAG